MSDNKVYPKDGEDGAPSGGEDAPEPPAYSETACGCIPQENPLRKLCIAIVEHPPANADNKSFDMLITFFIVLNTITLCLPNQSTCTTHIFGDDPYKDYDQCKFDSVPIVQGASTAMDILFSIVFTFECVVKIIAMGFIVGPNAYLKESWNVLDFIVVAFDLIDKLKNVFTFLTALPNLRMLRTFRMLRPLKSVNKLPGLRKLITAMLNSVPRLANVLFLLVFVLYIFSIVGITFFMGTQHFRCRLTPYPTAWPGPLTDFMSVEAANNCTTAHASCFQLYETQVLAAVAADPNAYKCNNKKNTDMWDKPEDCVWLINYEDGRICSPDGTESDGALGIGEHVCQPTLSYKTSYCGSNYDDRGQPRFIGSNVPYGFPRYKSGDYDEGLNFGFTTFDNLPLAFVTIFQSVTMEGWVDVMYQVMDGYNGPITAMIFALLIIFGSNLVLNLVLAVITSAIEEVDDEEEAAEEERKEEEHDEINAHMLRKLKDDSGREIEDESKIAGPRKHLHQLVLSRGFTYMIFAAIFANTIVLSLDEYPITLKRAEALERANDVFTWFFIFELVLKVAALTPKYYIKDGYNIFDAFIVFMSLVEMIAVSGGLEINTGAISGLRAVRITRVFKLAKEWQSLNLLIKNLMETIQEIGNFAFLLGLFMLIFALFGMQLFAGKMHYDDNGWLVPFVTRDTWKISELGVDSDGNDWTIDKIEGCKDAAGNAICTSTGEYFFTYFDDGEETRPKIATQEMWDAYYDADVSRANFDDLMQSLVTIFQILTGENWNAAMYDGLRVIGWPAFFFYFLLIVIGMFFVMNIFLAILLSKFEGNDEIVSKPSENSNRSLTQLGRQIRKTFNIVNTIRSPSKTDLQENEYKVGPDGEHSGEEAKSQEKTQVKKNVLGEAGSAVAHAGDHVLEGAEELVADLTEKVKRKPQADDDYALCIFPRTSPLRMWCEQVTSNPSFDNSIIVVILISSVTLVIDNPLVNPATGYMVFLSYLNLVFTFIFTVEMTLKIISNGLLLNGPSSYLCGGWNRLDFIIVLIALTELIPGASVAGGALRTVRTIRVLRPIRMVSRKKELKLVVDALLTSIPQVVNVLIVCLLFFLIFSVVFVNLYKGKFLGCDSGDVDMPSVGWDIVTHPPQTYDELADDSRFEGGLHFMTHFEGETANTCFNAFYNTSLVADQATLRSKCYKDGVANEDEYYNLQRDGTPCITSYQICTCLGFEWAPTTYQNFDNVMEALALLFEISTTEGWVDVMFAATDGTSIHMQPIRDIGYHHVIFFIIFMLFGAFLFMNLFVGVIIERFNQIRDEMQVNEGRSKIFMTPEQEEWSNTQQFILDKVKPKRKIRAKHQGAFEIVSDPKLDQFIMLCILLNSVVMGMSFFGQSVGYEAMLDSLNYIFAAIFTGEFIIKVIAIGWTQYARDGWNRFDFAIVIGTLLGIILEAWLKLQIGTVALVIRMVRMGRMFRLFNSAKTLKKLFNTIIASVPSLLNVCGLLSILLFVFAVLGLQCFATLPETDDINEHANFRSFEVALNTLLRFSTGENWNGVMHEMMNKGEYQELIDSGECESTDPNDIVYPKRETYPGNGEPDRNYGWCEWGITNEIEKEWGLHGCQADDTDFSTCCKDLSGCGQEYLLRTYFYLFTLTVTFVMLNLVIGIILDAFDGENQEDTSMLSEDNLAIFVEDWSKFDEDATYCIKLSQMRDFFQMLDAPMGFGEEVVGTDEQLLYHILELDLIIRESNVEPELGEIKFDIYDIASALGRRVCKLEAERKREGDAPIVLEPEKVPAYLSGVSHSPAREVILTFFEMTYGVVYTDTSVSSAPAQQAPPSDEPPAEAPPAE